MSPRDVRHDTDTTPSPPSPEELAYQRLLREPHTDEDLRQLCAAAWPAWVGRQRGSVAAYLAAQPPLRTIEIVVAPYEDGEGLIATIARGELEDIGAGVGDTTPHEALARLLAYLETDGVRS